MQDTANDIRAQNVNVTRFAIQALFEMSPTTTLQDHGLQNNNGQRCAANTHCIIRSREPLTISTRDAPLPMRSGSVLEVSLP